MHVRLRHAMPYLAVIMRTSYAGMTEIPVLMIHVILYRAVNMKISVEAKSVTKITFVIRIGRVRNGPAFFISQLSITASIETYE